MAENLVSIVAVDVSTPKRRTRERKQKNHQHLRNLSIISEKGKTAVSDPTDILMDFQQFTPTHTQIWTTDK